MTWGQASQTCIQHGGHLAVEQSSVVHDAIAAEVARQSGSTSWWIGYRNTIPFDLWFLSSNIILGEVLQPPVTGINPHDSSPRGSHAPEFLNSYQSTFQRLPEDRRGL